MEYEPDDRVDLIEYVDHECTVLVAINSPHIDQGPVIKELERAENPTGRCPVVVSSRISLDDARGQFDGILGMYQQRAKLMALEVLAVQKGVFPDTWLVGNAGEQPKIVNTANGLTGEIGVVRGGSLRDMQMQPGFMTNPAIDRLERAQRLTAGIPAEFGGESTSNIRTGRRGDAVLSAVVDFTVQETQKTLARSLEEENRIAIAQAKAYAGNKPKSFYVNMGKTKGKVDYTPNKHFTSDENHVSYSQAGADINNLVIAGGQRLAMGTMSKEAFMRIDPLVEDVEKERDSVVAEQLQQSLLAGLQQQASQVRCLLAIWLGLWNWLRTIILNCLRLLQRCNVKLRNVKLSKWRRLRLKRSLVLLSRGPVLKQAGARLHRPPLLFSNCWERCNAA